MRLLLAAVGRGMPGWIGDGFHEYARRMPPYCRLELKEVKPAPRGRHPDLDRLRQEEAARLEEAVIDVSLRVALDEFGRPWTTRELAGQLESWVGDGVDVALLVGGADGLDPGLIQRAHRAWSLSPLTLPHMLVRVVVAEQLYRAWSVYTGHPYHRD